MKKKADKSGSHISNGYMDYDFENAFKRFANDKDNPTKDEKLKGIFYAVHQLHPIRIEEILRGLDFTKHSIDLHDLLDHSNSNLLFSESSIGEFINKAVRGDNHTTKYRGRIEKLQSVIEKLINETDSRKLGFDKITFNGNTNWLWKLFSDNLEKGSFDTSKANLMRMITEVFLDKNGKEISISTLKSYSDPSKKLFTEPKKPHTPTKNKKK